MQAYDKMVDSGVDWIGLIPKGWAIEKVKRIFVKKNEKSAIMDPVVLSLARTGVKVRDISSNEGQLAASYDNYNPVEPGDILLNPMDLQSGANCSISKVEGVISPAYVNLRPIGNNNSQFFDYYFKLQYWSRAFFVHGRGISYDNRWTLGNETLMNYPVVVPAPAQQKSIADFLDEETAKIDNLIAKQEKLLKLLEEKRRATIAHAVTRGLDPKVGLKETNIPWLRFVPSNAEVMQLKNVLKLNTGGAWGDDPKDDGTDKIVLRSTEQTATGGWCINEPAMRQLSDSEFLKTKLEAGDLVITKSSGSELHIGKTSIVDSESLGMSYSNFMQRLRLKSDEVPKYYWYILNSYVAREQYNYFSNSTSGLANLNSSIFSNLYFTHFEKTVQQDIVKFLDEKETEAKLLRQKIQAQITLLLERRTSLISNAVTGKIKL